MNLPPEQYYATLPKHIAGAGMIFREADQDRPRILLVKPTYRADETWEIPGGGLEAGESPWEAAAREVTEELGVKITPGRLVAVDWVPAQADGRPPLTNFLFDGGLMSSAGAQQQIRLQPDELSGWRFAGAAEWDLMLPEHMARRVRACAAALVSGSTLYLQNGWPPPAQ